jgi:hypothetical protein
VRPKTRRYSSRQFVAIPRRAADRLIEPEQTMLCSRFSSLSFAW